MRGSLLRDLEDAWHRIAASNNALRWTHKDILLLAPLIVRDQYRPVPPAGAATTRACRTASTRTASCAARGPWPHRR